MEKHPPCPPFSGLVMRTSIEFNRLFCLVVPFLFRFLVRLEIHTPDTHDSLLPSINIHMSFMSYSKPKKFTREPHNPVQPTTPTPPNPSSALQHQ